MRNFTIHQGDVLAMLKSMESESVHCIITSPPYWNLRDYGVEGQVGLETSPEGYVETLVSVFREARRVLRSDGSLWLNLGDSYFGANWRASEAIGTKQATNRGANCSQHSMNPMAWRDLNHPSLKSKDLVGIPWRVAFALQSDGWWLRSDIIWAKPNPMPESVTDRPTKSHEYIFLLSKSERYFFDAEAVKEKASHAGEVVSLGAKSMSRGQAAGMNVEPSGNGNAESYTVVEGRNIRSVWTLTTRPFADAHFAVFPPEIPQRCILAGTSEKGVCAKCGAPWARVIERDGMTSREWQSIRGHGAKGNDVRMGAQGKSIAGARPPDPHYRTVDWQPSCKHEGEPIPATVMDIFCGSGTTGVVALRHGRRFIGIELNPEYAAMAERRIRNDAPLFNSAIA